MNRIYRLVWNAAKGTNQVASEKSSSRGKGKRGIRTPRIATLLLLSSPAAFAAGALPSAGSVVAGDGRIASDGTTMTIHQSTQKMAIDWQSFSIGSGHSVQFVQPSASSVALNRVTGAEVSLIQGALQANGQVFLLNPNGVLFSPTAQVNAGALVASTLNLRNEDFLAGRYAFEGASSHAVINQGNISVAAGGGVALIAAKVSNTGSIDAQQGHALLGAGSKVLLDFGGPVKLQLQQGAVDALVENGGAIRADGGTVLMTAKAAGELVSTVINNTGLVQARTLATGEQGTVLLLGDMAHGRIEVGGKLDARANGTGNGGFIETSAAYVNTAAGLDVDAGSASGKGGLWLVDPYDYTIHSAAATNITNALNTGTSVTITTQSNNASYGATASGNGDITVSSAITKSMGGDATLTLQADRSIFVNADISASSGKLNLTLSAANAAGATLGGVTVAGNLSSNGGNILIGGARGSTSNGIGFASNVNNSSAAVVIEQNKSILSTGGNITINGKSLVGSNSGSYSGVTGGVYVKSGATILSGSGNLFITGDSAGGVKTFGFGVEGNSGTVTTIGSSPGGGNMIIDGVNSTAGYSAAVRDQGALGLVSYGNRARVAFQGPSVASWLVFVNGAPQLSAYTQSPQLSYCSSPYPNCGTLVVPGSNNSYLYASYQAVSMATQPVYVIQNGAGSKTYDGNTVATGLSFTTLGGPAGFSVSALSPAVQYTTSSKNVGTYDSLTGSASNPSSYASGGTTYAVGYFNTGSYSITPKALTPIASDKVYDGNTVAAVTATGLIAGDSVTLSGTGSFASKDVGTYNNVGISGISLTGTDAGNYTLSGNSVSNATASILQRTVTLSATKVYDGSAAFSSGVSLGNLVNGEELVFSGATANSAHVGSAGYLSALTLADGSNGRASNYQLPSMTAASGSNAASITPKTLTATLANTGTTKVYDGSTSAPAGFTPVWNFGGFISGDTSATVSGTAAYDSAHVAAASKVTVSGLAIGTVSGSNGSHASDYALDDHSKFTSATITPKTVTATLANSNVSKRFDGTTSAPAGFAPVWSVAGLVSGDGDLNITYSGAAFDNSQVGAATRVSVSGMAISSVRNSSRGSLASDYTLSANSAHVNGSIVAATAATPPTAVLPAQYTAVAPTLLPPAAGELTYVATSGAAEMSYVAAPADGAAPASGAGSRPNSSLSVVNRQRKLASQAATVGSTIKTLDVMVISDGIRIPTNTNPQVQGK